MQVILLYHYAHHQNLSLLQSKRGGYGAWVLPKQLNKFSSVVVNVANIHLVDSKSGQCSHLRETVAYRDEYHREVERCKSSTIFVDHVVYSSCNLAGILVPVVQDGG